MTKVIRFIALTTLITLPMLVLGACGSNGNDSEAITDVVNSFYDAWNARDFEGCLELLSSSTVFSEDDIEDMSASRETAGELTITELEEPVITEETATVQAEISSGEQGQESIEIQLIKEDGSWKLGDYVISDRIAEEGDTVLVDYTLTLSDGTEVDSSKDRGPLQFTLGAGSMIQGFEKAIYGLKKGDTKTFTVPPEEGYGLYDEARLIEVDRDKLPSNAILEVGATVTITYSNGQSQNVPIVEITDTTVTLDTNPPLAGEELTFDVTFVGVISPIIPVSKEG